MFDYVSSWFKSDLVTSPGKTTTRLRVDSSNTGFWEGREFRLNHPLVANDFVIRVTAPIDFILQLQKISSEDGKIEMRAYRSEDGSEGGAWTPSPYYANNNQMTDATPYSGQITIDTGGTFTPTDIDTQKETIVAKAATATAQAQSVGGGSAKERGLPPGTYYLKFTGSGVGIYDLVLEERP